MSELIRPTGGVKRYLADCLYAVVSSIHGICAKLDLDNVTDTNYEALCYTAIFNGAIEDSKGNSLINAVSGEEDTFFIMSPRGYSNRAVIQCIYQIFLMMHTLTTKIDADAAPPTTVTYHHVFDDHYLWTIENEVGSTIGASTEHWIRPGGIDDKNLVDILYCFVHSLDTLTRKLDTDAVPSGSNYHALWDTANILVRVEDSKGNISGN
jgi:hypothetical protein